MVEVVCGVSYGYNHEIPQSDNTFSSYTTFGFELGRVGRLDGSWGLHQYHAGSIPGWRMMETFARRGLARPDVHISDRRWASDLRKGGELWCIIRI